MNGEHEDGTEFTCYGLIGTVHTSYVPVLRVQLFEVCVCVCVCVCVIE